jgi:hypothetical protein
MAFPSPAPIEAVLRRRTEAARENLLDKRRKFDALAEAIQQGLAVDSDAAQRLRAAGFEVSSARAALIEALLEFDAYLTRGIVPEEDLRSEEMGMTAAMACPECPRLLSEYATVLAVYSDAAAVLMERIKHADAEEFRTLTRAMDRARIASDAKHVEVERHISSHAQRTPGIAARSPM